MPRVSVNLCCYNSAAFLEDTLQSVYAQTYPDWELVIIDDASSDGTDALIQAHRAAGHPIVYESLSANVGLGAARNVALQRSSGELIAFIDHDDLWAPNKLARQVPLFDRDPHVGLVYSDCVNVWEHGYRFRQFDRLRPCEGDVFRSLLREYPVSIQTAMIHRRVLDGGTSGFDPRFRVLEDMEFILRLARQWRLVVVKEPLVWVKMRRASATRMHRDRFPVEMRLILEKLRELDPELDRTFHEEVERFLFGIDRLEARIAWERNQRGEALERLQAHRRRFPEAQWDVWLIRCLSYRMYDRLRLLAARLTAQSRI